MIGIDEITIRNFMSFGDYDTTIKISDLKSCLLTGEVITDQDDNVEMDSNGAGKSALVNAILWCLFGRTMHSASPGDKVINWFSKKGCYVCIKMLNGDKVIRTRKEKDGHDDLLLIKNGEDVSLGTNKMQQAELNRQLNLDYTLFCGSVFFAQYSKPWMEMSPTARKSALEREFRIDRMQLYADIAKKRGAATEGEQDKLRTQVNQKQLHINQLSEEIKELEAASSTFDSDKQRRVAEAEELLGRFVASRDAIIVPDIEDLKAKWEAIGKIEKILSQKQQGIFKLEAQRRQIENDITYQENLIRKWNNKVGICSECEQQVSSEYVSGKTHDPEAKKESLRQQREMVELAIGREKSKLDEARNQLEARKPQKTVQSAMQDKAEWDRRNRNVVSQQKTIEDIKAEENHYAQSIQRLKGRIDESQKAIGELLTRLKRLDIIVLHWNYIYKLYSDRRKLKAQVLCEYIPILNERIAYYLSRFGTKLRIEFTDGLGVKSNYWDYDFFCGGERKRVDVAMMLAMFDLHTILYGRQSNILVLDEVDGRLDPRGAKSLADIVRNELSEKADTILVISHRMDMRGALASEIRIRKENDLSTVKEILR